MFETATLKDKLKLFSFLLFPILITQLSLHLMSFFDTIMSGRFGAIDLAGVAIGSSLWVPVFTGVNGIVLAITPIIAQLAGAKQTDGMAHNVQQGIYLAIVLAIVVLGIGALCLNPILQLMDLETEVRHIAKYYLISLGTGLVPLFVFNTLRCFIEALGRTRLSMTIILITLPINIVLNYVFIFGKMGVPAYGGVGSGIATSITYWIICFVTMAIIYRTKSLQAYAVFVQWVKPSLRAWWGQLKLGLPIGLAIFFETGVFSAVTLLMSVYDTYTIAAHQAALNFSALLYMIPLSVGIALTIAVGFEVGAKRFDDARTYGIVGMCIGVIVAIGAGVILYVFDGFIAGLYNTEPEVMELTRHFIFFAIFFQLADALAAPIQGALRGYKDVNTTLVIAMVAFWVIGLPCGWLLANFTDFGPAGYWVGLIIGLSCGAVALLSRLLYIQRSHYRVLPLTVNSGE